MEAGTSNVNTTSNGASGSGMSGIFSLFTGKAAKAASKAVTGIKAIGSVLGKTVKVIIIAKVAMWALGKAFNWIDDKVHHVENLKKEVEDLTNTYEDAKKSFSDNLEALTTSSDVSVYATLQDEFDELAEGVDQYGNNISLTADEYERYKSICDQIVGVNPKIASGYDDNTKAIGKNVSILSQLIE
jgi:uncharacterized phage infection (PIP) family protein YhgE